MYLQLRSVDQSVFAECLSSPLASNMLLPVVGFTLISRL
jgi:hypothetical protein